MAITATDMFAEMLRNIEKESYIRISSDQTSPQQSSTLEAPFWYGFKLLEPELNVPTQRNISVKWAIANILHFFAGTEDASMLSKYNPLADRFAPDGKWVGAYGAIAMPQIRHCIELLTESRYSRRAFVQMSPPTPCDINRPSCWNFLQFIVQRGQLRMGVCQRSLNLFGVMPYDCTLLTNIMLFVASHLRMRCGEMHWTIGSLHKLSEDRLVIGASRGVESIVLPFGLLNNPAACLAELWDPTLKELRS